MSKDDKGAAARAALLKGEADRKADNAAAARKEAERNRPPVVCLGAEGSCNVYWSRSSGDIHKLKANEHTRNNLYRMARFEEYARWMRPDLPPDDAEEQESAIMKKAVRRLLEGSLGKRFNASRVRGRGVWPDDSGGWVYNAGASCWFIPADGGKIEQMDAVRSDYVYSAGVALPSPADTPLSDEEGRHLLELIRARSWVLPGAGDVMAGWMVAAMLAGVMPICPHVWINAPQGTGKSTFRDDLRAVYGDAKIDPDGGHTTDTGIRQTITGVALPVVIDEAEPGDDEKAQKNIRRWIELMRIASYGGTILHGGADGTPRKYSIKCSFALFSVANSIERAADSSRCIVLDLKKYREDEHGKAEKDSLWARQDAGRALVKTPGFHGRLVARLLQSLPVLMGNLVALRKHLSKVEGVDSRRAELFAVLMACRHALVSRERMSQEAMQEAAALMLAYGEQEEKESDFSRCLVVLLDVYQVDVFGAGKMSVSEACRMLRNSGDPERKETIARALNLAGLRWRDDLNALQVDTLADKMKRIYTGTQWSNGKVAPVLAEGCKREKGSISPAGVWLHPVKVGGTSPRWCVMIPAALVLGEDE